jgi:hypothetical protein
MCADIAVPLQSHKPYVWHTNISFVVWVLEDDRGRPCKYLGRKGQVAISIYSQCNCSYIFFQMQSQATVIEPTNYQMDTVLEHQTPCTSIQPRNLTYGSSVRADNNCMHFVDHIHQLNSDSHLFILFFPCECGSFSFKDNWKIALVSKQ